MSFAVVFSRALATLLAHAERLRPQKAICVKPAADHPDLSALKGQPTAHRALEIAAAGSHSILRG